MTNKKGETALTLACVNEDFNISERLIIAKSDLNVRDPSGRTPLMHAARVNKSTKILTLLVDNGAMIDIIDK